MDSRRSPFAGCPGTGYYCESRWVAGSRYYEGRVKDQQPPRATVTGDEFRSRYKLLKVVDEQGVQSHHALSPTGRVVMVHFLAGAPLDDQRRLLALLDRLRPVDRTRILDKLDVDGATVLVTEFIQGFKTLLAWLESKAKLPPTESALTPPAASSPASAPAPGDFTRMFGADELGKVDQESPPVPPSPAPGGFTAFFGAVAAEPPTPSPSVDEPAQQSSDVPPARTDAPDANRRPVVRWRDEPAQKPDDSRAKPVIRWNAESPAPPVPTAPPVPAAPPPAPAKKPGEFTQLFGAVGATPPATPASAPDSPASPSAPGSARPGAFTNMFNPVVEPASHPLGAAEPSSERLLRALDAPATPSGSVAPSGPLSERPPGGPNQAAAPGEFTRMLSGIPAPGAAQGAGARAPEGPGMKGGGGGSEYTRLVAAQPSSTAPAPKSGTPAAPAAGAAGDSPGRPLLPLILGGAALALLMAVALYFILR